MHEMDTAEWIAFVNAGTRTGKLAVVKADGSPHVSPVWFEVSDDGTELIFLTGANTTKGRALRRDSPLSLCVDAETAPYSFVQITADATVGECDESTLPIATRIATRYMGSALGEQYGQRNNVADEYLVRGRITAVIAVADIAD